MRRTATLITGIALLVGLTGCSPTPDPVGAAADALETLAVKGRAPMTGYDREGKYGPAWKDVDGNGCDTRNDILQRDLDDERLDSDGCTVLTGILHDPYSGKDIQFTRGVGTSAEVQADHIVPLAESWRSGAQQWGKDNTKREQFANDPLNLLAVDGPLNEQKSDANAASWLPPNKSYRCEYVARQVAVKVKYGLWVTQAEHDAIASVLATCPGQELPSAADNGYSGETDAVTPTPDESTAGAGKGETVEPLPSGPTRYGSCKEAKAAGEGRYQKGVDPQYEWYSDGDGDGIACE